MNANDNGNAPATYIPEWVEYRPGMREEARRMRGTFHPENLGFTKREVIAKDAMSAIISGQCAAGGAIDDTSAANVAKLARHFADALLEALNW